MSAEPVRKRVERARGCVAAEGEFGRGETEREREEEGTRRGEERRESPLADYVPSPPRSFTPAMFFLLLSLSSATTDDLAGYNRVHPCATLFSDGAYERALRANKRDRCATLYSLDFVQEKIAFRRRRADFVRGVVDYLEKNSTSFFFTKRIQVYTTFRLLMSKTIYYVLFPFFFLSRDRSIMNSIYFCK